MAALMRLIKRYDKKATFNSDLRFDGAILYVVRPMSEKNQNGYNIGNSKPCKHCQYYLKKFGIKKVYYTDILENCEYLCEMRII